jgi:hypothetical protein
MKLDRISNVPKYWAHGGEVSYQDRLGIALLRLAGCQCELPLLRTSYDASGVLSTGPRCKSCDRKVELAEPTVEETLTYRRQSHHAVLRYEITHPGALAAAFDGWRSECFPGCGCELQQCLNIQVRSRRDGDLISRCPALYRQLQRPRRSDNGVRIKLSEDPASAHCQRG